MSLYGAVTANDGRRAVAAFGQSQDLVASGYAFLKEDPGMTDEEAFNGARKAVMAGMLATACGKPEERETMIEDPRWNPLLQFLLDIHDRGAQRDPLIALIGKEQTSE